MYQEFFGFRARPFGITPSADLFFYSSTHRRALAWLQGQALAGEPVIVLSGDIGAGKTTLLQVLIRELSTKFRPAFVVTTQLDAVELTRSLLIAFGAGVQGDSLEQLRSTLRVHLDQLRAQSRRGLVIVDEAQNLSPDALQYLLHLPGLVGKAENPSPQVIVSGQPRLAALLVDAVGERGFAALGACELKPMSAADTGAYVRYRLAAVARDEFPAFSTDAIDEIHRATGGLPRLVNRLCDRVLLSAYLDETGEIDGARVAKVATELREELGDAEMPVTVSVNPQRVEVDPRPVDVAATVTTFEPGPQLAGFEVDAHAAEYSPPPSPMAPPATRAPAMPVVAPPAGKRRWSWAVAAAITLLVVQLGWFGADRWTARNSSRIEVAGPAGQVRSPLSSDSLATAPAPTGNSRAEGSSTRLPPAPGRSATGSAVDDVRQPARGSRTTVDVRAALGLAPASEMPAALTPEPAPGDTPTTRSAPAPALVASATAPAEPRDNAPSDAPARPSTTCSAATKALGLCP